MDAILGVTTPVRTVDGQVGTHAPIEGHWHPGTLDSTGKARPLLLLRLCGCAPLSHGEAQPQHWRPSVSVVPSQPPRLGAWFNTVNSSDRPQHTGMWKPCGSLTVAAGCSGRPEDPSGHAARHHAGDGQARRAPARLKCPRRPPGAFCSVSGTIRLGVWLYSSSAIARSCSASATPCALITRDHSLICTQVLLLAC